MSFHSLTLEIMTPAHRGAVRNRYSPFFDFIDERHRIYTRKERSDPWPSTKGKILQTYKFTNVYRDLDAVSVDFRRAVLDAYRPWNPRRAAALVGDVIARRLFNWPPTWKRLARARYRLAGHPNRAGG